MKSHITAILILIGVAGFTGCTISKGPKVEQSSVSKIEKGVTTKSDLIAQFGNPSSSEINSEGKETLTWAGASGSVDAKSMIPLVGRFVGDRSTGISVLTVILGKDGKVESYTYSNEKH